MSEKCGEGVCLCKNEQLEKLIEKLLNLGVIKVAPDNTHYISPEIELSKFNISYGFSDIALLQNKNQCKSRLEVNITSEIMRGLSRPVPLIASNMSTVTNAEFCIELYNSGALGILHRAAPMECIVEAARKISSVCPITAVSVGVGPDQLLLCRDLINAGATVICIDVAHGYSDNIIDFGRKIRKEFPGVKIIIGNTINPDMLKEVDDFADAVKVGIANGLACKTKNTAACNEKQFSSVYKFKELSKALGLPIISDGGIREPADFVKAIAAGASSVMAGSIFAACPESAAPVHVIDGAQKKLYAGMASREVQIGWKNGVKPGTCTEGKQIYLDLGESVADLLERYSGALRSGVTYAGGTDIVSFQDRVKFTVIK